MAYDSLTAVDVATAGIPDAPSGMTVALIYFIPRVSIVLIIEVFAYFFLNVYKSGLADIKYYQNELTNVEAQFAAVHSAIASGDKALVKKVVERLANTERNFVLVKGQSTVDLERAKRDPSSSDIMKTIAELTKAAKS